MNDEGYCLRDPIAHAEAERPPRRLPGLGCCLTHAQPEDRAEYYERVRANPDILWDEGHLQSLRIGDDLMGYIQRLLGEVPGASVDLQHSTFGGAVDFTGFRFGRVNLYNAQFEGSADFSEAVFERQAFFAGTKFGGPARTFFRNTQFEAEVDFGYAVFRGDVDFANARFGINDHKADFTSAEFRGDASFYLASFEGGAKFDYARFGDDDRSKFRNSHFTGAEFHDEASFLLARFGDKAFFHDAHFGINGHDTRFDKARFEDGGFFTGAVFGGPADFTDTKFAAYAGQFGGHFERTQFQEVTFACSDRSAQDIRTLPGFDLSSAVLSRGARFDRRRFQPPDVGGKVGVDLTAAHVGGDLTFADATCDGAVLLHRLVLTAPITIGTPGESQFSLRGTTLTKPLTLTRPVAPRESQLSIMKPSRSSTPGSAGAVDAEVAAGNGVAQVVSLENSTLEAPLVVGGGDGAHRLHTARRHGPAEPEDHGSRSTLEDISAPPGDCR